MINKFLKAKHWQLFVLMFGMPFGLQIIMMPIITMNQNPTLILAFIPIVLIFFMGIFFGWFWSIAIGLQQVIPTEYQLSVGRFKIFLFVPITYIFFFLSFFLISYNSGGPNPEIFAIIVPLHLFSMFCILYCMYFTAKTYKTSEQQRDVNFSDFAGEFFLIWFFPIGVWIVQPKINKIITEKVER